MNDHLIDFINRAKIGYYQTNISFKDLTSFKVGGTVRLYLEPFNQTKLIEIIKYLNIHQIKYLVIGRGTNILASDQYFDLVLINLKRLNKVVRISSNCYQVESGKNLIGLAVKLTKDGYRGLEGAGVIPGSLGGAIYMNASAYKKELASIVKMVEYLDSDGEIHQITDNIFTGYRRSFFTSNQHNYIITSCQLQLTKNDNQLESWEKLKGYWQVKLATQPLKSKNAGSVFKNPDSPLPAWYLIDQCGLRGYRIGDAMVSLKHANFIVNLNQASFDDIMSLINLIKAKVKQQFQINLECELRIITPDNCY